MYIGGLSETNYTNYLDLFIRRFLVSFKRFNLHVYFHLEIEINEKTIIFIFIDFINESILSVRRESSFLMVNGELTSLQKTLFFVNTNKNFATHRRFSL